MDEFAKSMGSISWWLSVVLVGIILNVLSAYLKPALDTFLSRVSSWWRNRSAKARMHRALIVAELRKDNHKQVLMLAQETRYRFRSVSYLLLSLAFLVMYLALKISASTTIVAAVEPPPFWFRQVVYWSSLFLIFFSFIEHTAAMRCQSLIADVEQENEIVR